MPTLINDAFMKFTRRAEAVERSQLVETFVDAGPLFTLLSSIDHQIMYGRRGTGKTHALSYLIETRVAEGDVPAYVDMRTVGSTGGIYADPSLPITERATRLLVDTLLAIHTGLLEFSINQSEEINLSQAGPILDRLADAITQVKVVGEIVQTVATNAQSTAQQTSNVGLTVSPQDVGIELRDAASSSQALGASSETLERGVKTHRVHFGSVRQAIAEFADLISPRRVWLVLDEWSDVPLDLQPILADLLRRSLFPVRGVTVKIGAIEHRSAFRQSTPVGDYIGIELGADAAADLNLDDFMVFDNDADRAKQFFQEFLFKHLRAAIGDDPNEGPRTAGQLISMAFTQRNAFDEFVRAIEGVPRDAINIIALAAQRALDDPVSVPHVRAAANTWYQRDKQPAIASTPAALDLLTWIINRVIGERRARAFLLMSGARHLLIDTLFDARVLHVLKRGIAAQDQPGVRFDVYKLDFGCYVDLIATARSPQGLIPMDEEGGFIEVPPDDYRAIRRAILDIDEFTAEGGNVPASTDA